MTFTAQARVIVAGGFCAALVLWVVPLVGQTLPARPQVRAIEIDLPPAWENIFAEALWQDAASSTQMLQAPLNATFAAPPEETRVRVLWCKEFLLVRFDVQDASIVRLPGVDAAKPLRDEPYYKADAVEVFLDPVGDFHMYMEFQFSSENGVFDAAYFCTGTPKSQPDFLLDADFIRRDTFSVKEWNLAGLRSAARIWPTTEGAGWSVVAAFPAKELLQRLGKKKFERGMELKVNFVRLNSFADGQHRAEITNWAPVMEGRMHRSPAGMGTILLEPRP